MKIRNGFVSNSSSSSFCIAKCYMTKEQIDEFDEILGKIDIVNENSDDIVYHRSLGIEYDENTYIYSDENYFMGDIGYVHDDVIREFLNRSNLHGKFMWEE